MHNRLYFYLQVSIMMMITFRLLDSSQSLCNQTWRLILACSAFTRFNALSWLQLMKGAGLGIMDLCVTIKGVSFLLQTGMVLASWGTLWCCWPTPTSFTANPGSFLWT